jgi:hypothetical protein
MKGVAQEVTGVVAIDGKEAPVQKAGVKDRFTL